MRAKSDVITVGTNEPNSQAHQDAQRNRFRLRECGEGRLLRKLRHSGHPFNAPCLHEIVTDDDWQMPLGNIGSLISPRQ
jgi:hypothetical protein